MLIIIDHKMSPEAKSTLSSYGQLMELATEGITYPAISGHPDVFFCQAAGKLIVAPNLPQHYFDQLEKHNIDFITGELPVGREYPASAPYNAVATENYLIHNFRHTDPVITRTMKDIIPVHVDQGYCRCNLLPLKDDHFITSDAGILKVLKGLQPPGPPAPGASSPKGRQPKGPPALKKKETKTYPNSTFNLQPSTFLFVSPEDILLEGFPHGFFAGCCGVWEDKVFINGSLKFYKDGDKVRNFLKNLEYEIVELHPVQMEDCGSIFCL